MTVEYQKVRLEGTWSRAHTDQAELELYGKLARPALLADPDWPILECEVRGGRGKGYKGDCTRNGTFVVVVKVPVYGADGADRANYDLNARNALFARARRVLTDVLYDKTCRGPQLTFTEAKLV